MKLQVVIVALVGVIAIPSNCWRIVGGDGELLSVVTFSRHGNRSPKESFPNDQYFSKKYFPMGFGQLTKDGIRHQYELGRWFRKRYGSFISNTYSSEEIYVYSTDTDRTLMSAQANLAGLYPPYDEQVWNENIPWQPIPVHTTAREKDDIIVDKRTCKKWKSMRKELRKEIYKDLQSQYGNLFAEVQNYTGWNEVTPDEIATIFDVMYIYGQYNSEFIPEWYSSFDDSIKQVFEDVKGVTLELPTHNKKLTKLRTGPFNNFLFNHFDNLLNSLKSPHRNSSQIKDNDDDEDIEIVPKFILIFGHESSLASILNTYGAYDQGLVGFCYTLIFELRRKGNEYFISAFYKRDTDEVEGLDLMECGKNCTYQELKSMAKDVTLEIKEWEKACKND